MKRIKTVFFCSWVLRALYLVFFFLMGGGCDAVVKESRDWCIKRVRKSIKLPGMPRGEMALFCRAKRTCLGVCPLCWLRWKKKKEKNWDKKGVVAGKDMHIPTLFLSFFPLFNFTFYQVTNELWGQTARARCIKLIWRIWVISTSRLPPHHFDSQ